MEVAGSSLLLADAEAEDNSAAAAVPAAAPATPTPTAPPMKLCPSSPWSEVQLLITLSSTWKTESNGDEVRPQFDLSYFADLYALFSFH